MSSTVSHTTYMCKCFGLFGAELFFLSQNLWVGRACIHACIQSIYLVKFNIIVYAYLQYNKQRENEKKNTERLFYV